MIGREQVSVGASASFVIATYREIADRFGLGSSDAARVRAKRAGWEREPGNHPLDPVRVRVPTSAWEQTTPDRPRSPRSAEPDPLGSPVRSEANTAPDTHPIALLGSDPIKPLADAVTVLREQLDRERERTDQRIKEAAELRERIGRAEAERDQARQRVQEVEAERGGAEKQAEAVQAELTAWMAGGPFARVWRALRCRPG